MTRYDRVTEKTRMSRQVPLFLFVLCIAALTPLRHAAAGMTIPEDSVRGSIFAQVFFHGRIQLSAARSPLPSFELSRAHLGYRYNFGHGLSSVCMIDAGRPTLANGSSTSDLQPGSAHTMSLKFAWLDWQPDPAVSIKGGSVLLSHYIPQERFWGLRYIAETPMDRYFRLPSADLGVIVSASPYRLLQVDAAVTNGEGFRGVQDRDGYFRYAGGITLGSADKLHARLYYQQNRRNGGSTVLEERYLAASAGFKASSGLRLGGEVDIAWHPAVRNSEEATVGSVYAVVTVIEALECFLRLDWLSDSGQSVDDNTTAPIDGKAMIAGVSLAANPKVRLSLNYQLWLPDHDASHPAHDCRLSTEFLY